MAIDYGVHVTGIDKLELLNKELLKQEQQVTRLTSRLGLQYLETQKLDASLVTSVAANKLLTQQYREQQLSLTGLQVSYKKLEADLLTVSAATATTTASTAAATVAQQNLRSVIRGTAGAMGGLWLAYGNIIPMLGAFAVAATAIKSVKLGAEFEYTTKYLSTLADLSGDVSVSLSGVREEILGMRDSRHVVTELALGLREFSKAGVSTKDGLRDLGEMSRFASIAEMGLADSTALVIGQANAFGKTYAEAANMITAAATSSATSVQGMAQAMSYTTELGSIASVEFRDVATALALMANAGIRESKAGTAVRTSIMRMYTPTEKLTEMFDRLNVSWSAFNVDGSQKDVVTMFRQLKEVTDPLTDKSRLEIMRELFGLRALKGGANILRNVNTEWDAMNKHISGSVEGLTLLQQMSDSLKDETVSRWERFKNNFSGLMASLSTSGAANAGITFLDELTTMLRPTGKHFYNLSENMQQATEDYIELTYGTKAYAEAAGDVVTKTNEVTASTESTEVWGQKVGVVLTGLGVKTSSYIENLRALKIAQAEANAVSAAANKQAADVDRALSGAFGDLDKPRSSSEIGAAAFRAVDDQESAAKKALAAAKKAEAAKEAHYKEAMRNVKRRVADQEREEKNYAKKHAAIASFGSSMGALSEESKFVSKEATRTAEIDKVFQDHLITLGKAIGTHSQAYINAEQQATALKETYKANDIELLRSSNTVKDGMLAGYKEISKDIGTMSEAVADSFVTTFDTSADSLANFVTTGKFNFKSFATSVISDIGDIMAAQAASGLLGMGLNLAIGAASTYFGGGVNQSTTFSGGGTSTLPANTAYAADGAVWGGGFKAFASGASVVSEPTLGLVGEGKYNEAIVPLPDGKSIPVQMKNSGGGNLTIATTINVSSGAGGSDADKDSLANKMALAIKKHVKEILVQERQRYGGLLYSGA